VFLREWLRAARGGNDLCAPAVHTENLRLSPLDRAGGLHLTKVGRRSDTSLQQGVNTIRKGSTQPQHSISRRGVTEVADMLSGLGIQPVLERIGGEH